MGWINKISEGIESAFSMVRPALNLLPPLLLICEVKNRPGLSAIALTSLIIRELPKAQIETGLNNCGSPNKINQFVRIVCEELIKEIKDNAVITCAVETSKVNSIGSGGNAGGPIVVTSTNTIPSLTLGIIE